MEDFFKLDSSNIDILV